MLGEGNWEPEREGLCPRSHSLPVGQRGAKIPGKGSHRLKGDLEQIIFSSVKMGNLKPALLASWGCKEGSGGSKAVNQTRAEGRLAIPNPWLSDQKVRH